MLLVVTNKADLASDYFILRVKERGFPFVRLNTEDLGTGFSIDIYLSGADRHFRIVFADGRVLGDADISAVYFRQARAPLLLEEVAESERAFAVREAKEQLRSLWRLIDPDKWLNHPRDLWRAANKVEQLAIAPTLGFTIPETLISISPTAVSSFYESCAGRVVCKAVKHGFYQHDNVVSIATTQRLQRETISELFHYAPVAMIFQREIPKRFDIRVTVVGDDVYATAIHSQTHSETEVDWRTWDASAFELRHEPIDLPADVAAQCRRITRHFNLGYSAIDLISGADGLFYFLEVNPNGQWVWIERRAGYPIRDAILRVLGVRESVYA